MSMEEKQQRFADRLDETLAYLREDRHRDAADVINEIPADEAADYIFFLSMHVYRDLEVLKSEMRQHMREVLAIQTPSMS